MEDSSLDDFLGGDSEEDEPTESARAGESRDDDTATDEQLATDERTAADEVTQDGEADGEVPDGEGADDEETDGDAADGGTVVEPATPTMVYSPDGSACEACGTPTKRRWRTAEGLHCEDCTEW